MVILLFGFGIIALLILLFFGFFYIFTYSPSIKSWINYIEKFIGQYKIIKHYSVLEYEYQNLHPDQPLKLLIQLQDSDYAKVLEFISTVDYANIKFGKKNPIRGMWRVTAEEFYLDTNVLPDYSGVLHLGISGNHQAKTILLTSCTFQ